MVGEIRDLETADIAIKAAQTGHLVLSTLHTNDAPATLVRLHEHGRRPVQHRLVSDPDHRAAPRAQAVPAVSSSPRTSRPRRCCARASANEDLDGSWQPFGPVGCDNCKDTGYKGRLGIYEVMPISDDMRQLIMRERQRRSKSPTLARREGMHNLRQSGLLKVKAGTHVPRGNRGCDQRVIAEAVRIEGQPWPPHHRAATQTLQLTFLWEGMDRNKTPVRGEMRASSETVVDHPPAAPGHPRHQGQAPGLPGRQQDQRKGHHVLHAPARDDAARRRAAAAVLRHRRPRPQQPAVLAADAGHQEQGGNGLQPVRRRSASTPRYFDSLFCNLVAAGETGGYPRRHPRPAGDLQGKDPRRSRARSSRRCSTPISVIVVAIVVICGHHDLRDPGVQGACSRASAPTCRRPRWS